MALPLRLGQKSAGQVTTLRVLRRFEFDPAVMRSAVVAVDCDDPDRGMFFVRGAPSVVEQLVRGGQVPPDYRQASLSDNIQRSRCMCTQHCTVGQVLVCYCFWLLLLLL